MERDSSSMQSWARFPNNIIATCLTGYFYAVLPLSLDIVAGVEVVLATSYWSPKWISFHVKITSLSSSILYRVSILRLSLSLSLCLHLYVFTSVLTWHECVHMYTYIWTYIWILETLASLRFFIFAFSIRSCISLAFCTIGAAIWAVVLDLEVSVSLIVFHMFVYACSWMWIFVN